MVAAAHYIPKDPGERESVLAVLRDHVGLQSYIAYVSDVTETIFPGARITLDTVGYDEWDPPVRMVIHVTQPWDEYLAQLDGFIHRIAHHSGFDPETIVVMPEWDGPMSTFHQ